MNCFVPIRAFLTAVAHRWAVLAMTTLRHAILSICIIATISVTGCRTSPPAQLIAENISILGGPTSYIEGKMFTSTYDSKMLQAAPRWNPGRGKPPLSVSAAARAASKVLKESVENIEEWELREITLRQPFGSFDEIPKGFWVYCFNFVGPKARSDTAIHRDSFIGIVVLMNGEAVPLKPVGPRE